MINRRTLLALLGLAPLAPTVPAVAAVPPTVDDTDSYTGHGIVQWSDHYPDSLFYVVVKNQTTGDVCTYTTMAHSIRFRVRSRFHHFRVSVHAIARDGSKQYTPHYDLDFAEGDPVIA